MEVGQLFDPAKIIVTVNGQEVQPRPAPLTHRYIVPLVSVRLKDGPATRRELRLLAQPLREGCIRFGSERAAWPHGSLQYVSRSWTEKGHTKHMTVAYPGRFDAGVLYWETDKERPLLPYGPVGMTAEVPEIGQCQLADLVWKCNHGRWWLLWWGYETVSAALSRRTGRASCPACGRLGRTTG